MLILQVLDCVLFLLVPVDDKQIRYLVLSPNRATAWDPSPGARINKAM